MRVDFFPRGEWLGRWGSGGMWGNTVSDVVMLHYFWNWKYECEALAEYEIWVNVHFGECGSDEWPSFIFIHFVITVMFASTLRVVVTDDHSIIFSSHSTCCLYLFHLLQYSTCVCGCGCVCVFCVIRLECTHVLELYSKHHSHSKQPQLACLPSFRKEDRPSSGCLECGTNHFSGPPSYDAWNTAETNRVC